MYRGLEGRYQEIERTHATSKKAWSQSEALAGLAHWHVDTHQESSGKAFLKTDRPNLNPKIDWNLKRSSKYPLLENAKG
jgi:hypothetical protein